MKNGIFLILIFGLIGFSGTMEKNQEHQYFIQFKIHTISTNEEATAIDDKIGGKSGIFSIQTDHITSTCFCLLNPGDDYSEDDFIGWFKKMGYAISCFHKGVQSVDAVLSTKKKKKCVEEDHKH